MKKVLIAGVFLLGVVMSMSAGTTPLLAEAYQEGQKTIPADENDTLTVVEITFSVDSTCYIQFTAGGLGYCAKLWLELDGDRLPPPEVQVTSNDRGGAVAFNVVYSYLLDPKEYTVSLRLSNYFNHGVATRCEQAYLQTLIFLPDAGGAVMETPIGDTEPLPNTPSVLSSGPYVNVTGASELVDSSGRIIENAISEDKVYISDLPTGTYFARNEERTIVKIVKVD